MLRGVWHQCGYNTQKVVLEFLKAKIGVGAIISPKDLGLSKAREYADQYRDLNAGVLLDPQFYEPEYNARNLATYPISEFRKSIRGLGTLPADATAALIKAIAAENESLRTTAVIAPAVPY